jgi:hypothetical protein
MTLNELTYQIIEAVRPEIHDDDVLDMRLIKDLIHNQRSIWLRAEMNKHRYVPEEVIQDLGCVPLVKAPVEECCDFSSACTILRTQNRIPTPIALHHREAIERVSPINVLGKPFSFKTYREALFFGNGRFNRKMAAAFFRNGYIYIVTKDPLLNMMTTVNIRMVAADPTEAAAFNLCTGQACYSDDMQYPLTDWMWGYMKEYVVKQVLMKYQIGTDTTNDSTHTPPAMPSARPSDNG